MKKQIEFYQDELEKAELLIQREQRQFMVENGKLKQEIRQLTAENKQLKGDHQAAVADDGR